MLDDFAKTERLMAEFETALPVEARLSSILKQTMIMESSDVVLPDSCCIVGLYYMGDEGGILCRFEIGEEEPRKSCYASITHLVFDRRHPLFRQIEAYQRHRVKKLKQQESQIRYDA